MRLDLTYRNNNESVSYLLSLSHEELALEKDSIVDGGPMVGTDSCSVAPFVVRTDGYREESWNSLTEPANWLLGATELVGMEADIRVDDDSEPERLPVADRPTKTTES